LFSGRRHAGLFRRKDEPAVQRLNTLDGLRALAAIAVVAFHCRMPGFTGGFYGVDVFFVLSGYLITGLLLAEIGSSETIALGAFYARRLVRLLPAFALMLAGFAIAAPFAFPGLPLWPEIVLPGLYVSNIARAVSALPAVNSHSWSLAMEMQFYLLWPLLLLALRRLPRQRLLLVLAGLYVAATLWRWIACLDADWSRVFFAPDTRLSGLIMGGIAAALPRHTTPAVPPPALPAALLVLLLLIATARYGAIESLLLGTTIVELASAVLILGLGAATASGAIARFLSAPAMVRLGLWSYGIYLWHYPIARVTRDLYEPWQALAVTLLLSIPLAALSFHLVERPVSRYVAGRRALSSAAPRPPLPAP
jgi:peptidoglycan/LPS O-acetylase OafA/YrhL